MHGADPDDPSDEGTPVPRRLLLHAGAACAAGALCAILAPSALADPVRAEVNAGPIAQAITSQDGLLVGAEWVSGPAGESAVGIGTYQGHSFPTEGETFGVLTTGSVDLIDHPDLFDNAGESLGVKDRGVFDVSILRLDLDVPAGRTCLSLDAMFLSEEYSEYVGSKFNDAFLVELDDNDWSVSGSDVDAPSNFAFDPDRNLLTINTVLFAGEGPEGLEYDGATELLRIARPITPGAHSLYLTVFDAGDTALDSAAFIDNLRTTALGPEDCEIGADRLDADEDGLPDLWEETGDTDGDGVMDVNLPAMGADPMRKDIFVQLDLSLIHI